MMVCLPAPHILYHLPAGKPNGIPTVIRWTGGPATAVRILGQFNDWQKTGIPLNKSGEDFYIILNLEKGEHEFKVPSAVYQKQ